MTKAEFLAMVKNHMRNYKNQYLNGVWKVDGKIVGIKLYGKSICDMTVDNMRTGGIWDIPTQKRVLEIIDEYLSR